ncbi:MAG: hypothetical protein KGI47_03850 [Betaproteobacteria bacterium]|nr:hypothetical protein [Betaproteobacteria bacterium]MDE2621985.1 hypothetical protein [Betaproteobacteria bacterium]
MSELQTGLALLGAALIVGIFVFSRIQEYRYRRMAEQVLPDPGRDALMDDDAPAVRSEPGFSEPESGLPGLSGLPETPAPDSAVEFTVLLRGSSPATAAQLWQALVTAAVTTRHVRWVGLEAAAGRWSAIEGPSEHRFDLFAAMLQLASRSGPVNESRLALFSDEMQAVARELQWTAESADQQAALATAEALDRFCAKVDVLIGMNVMFAEGREPPAKQVRERAEREGLALGQDGVFHAYDDLQRTRFTLAHRDGMPFLDMEEDFTPVPGVTFLLDVPRVPDAHTALTDMFAMADRLAQGLGGRLVDDNGAALGPRQLVAIQKQLSGILQQMDKQGVPAGSELALRLFSN